MKGEKMITLWEESNMDWQENFDRCAFCNGLVDSEELKEGLCPDCFGEIYELPETVRVDADLDDLYGLSFLD